MVSCSIILVVYGYMVRMSIKGKGIVVNNMEVPNEDPSLRISMANLCLRDDF